MIEIAIRSIPAGHIVTMLSGKEVLIVRHGDMGTIVKPTHRVAKSVTDTATGKTIMFSSESDTYVISSASPCQTQE
jgi:virulence-associated protein VagC